MAIILSAMDTIPVGSFMTEAKYPKIHSITTREGLFNNSFIILTFNTVHQELIKLVDKMNPDEVIDD